MKKALIITVAAVATLSLISGCKDESQKTAAKAPEEKQQSQQMQQAQQQQQQQPTAGKSGTVVETMDAAGYTYVQVDTGTEKIWAAAPQFNVSEGDPVIVPEGMPMENYHSKTLDRDFDLVYFVDSVMVGGSTQASGQQMPKDHPNVSQEASTQTEVDVSGVEKIEGGQTVGEIFEKKDELAGEQIKVRGKVVKFNQQIMGKNWIHLQDGTGGAGANDLTVTTDTAAQIGDTVVVSGVLHLDKDFGYGYKYDVIVEDAEVSVEN